MTKCISLLEFVIFKSNKMRDLFGQKNETNTTSFCLKKTKVKADMVSGNGLLPPSSSSLQRRDPHVQGGNRVFWEGAMVTIEHWARQRNYLSFFLFYII